jgi:hypothetical protein
MARHLGVVLHVNDSVGNLFNWVNGDHNVSCHFEVYKSGLIEQYLDTSMTSWCQADGNPDYLSIETEGFPGQGFTPAQAAAIVGLLRWIHATHGIPLVLADEPGQAGFGWHGMGGAAWGGHPDCPGDKRKADRAGLLEQAKAPAVKKSIPLRWTDEQLAARKELAGLVEVKPDGYLWRVFSSSQKPGPAYAAAPGRWRRLDAYTLRAMVRAGLCANEITLVRAATLKRLRALHIGRNT